MGDYVDLVGGADHLIAKAGQIRERLETFQADLSTKAQNVIAHEKWGEPDDFTTKFRHGDDGKGYDSTRDQLIGPDGIIPKIAPQAISLIGIYQSAIMNVQDQDGKGGDAINKTDTKV